MTFRTKEEIMQMFPDMFSEIEPEILQHRINITNEIIKGLAIDEKVFYLFWTSWKKCEKGALVAVTNRRVIICGKPSTFFDKILGKEQYKLESYGLDMLYDLRVKKLYRNCVDGEDVYGIELSNQYKKEAKAFGPYFHFLLAEQIMSKIKDALIEIKNL